jgi:hypothetical protein
MQAPREQDSAWHRPRLSIVRSELLSRRSAMGRERGCRLPAHAVEFDERSLPITRRRLPPPISEDDSRPIDQRADETPRDRWSQARAAGPPDTVCMSTDRPDESARRRLLALERAQSRSPDPRHAQTAITHR